MTFTATFQVAMISLQFGRWGHRHVIEERLGFTRDPHFYGPLLGQILRGSTHLLVARDVLPAVVGVHVMAQGLVIGVQGTDIGLQLSVERRSGFRDRRRSTRPSRSSDAACVARR